MGMTFDRIAEIGKFKEEGAWVAHIPDLPGIRLKVRGIWNTDAVRMYAEARAAATDEQWKDEKFQNELDIRVTCEARLVDWDGFDDPEGERDKDGKLPPLLYDPEIAKMFMAEKKYQIFRDAVQWASNNVSVLGQAALEDVAKN